MVQFLPLDVTDEDSIGVVLSHIDNAIQCVIAIPQLNMYSSSLDFQVRRTRGAKRTCRRKFPFDLRAVCEGFVNVTTDSAAQDLTRIARC